MRKQVWCGYLGINVYWPLELLQSGLLTKFIEFTEHRCWRATLRNTQERYRVCLLLGCVALAFCVASVDKCMADQELKGLPIDHERSPSRPLTCACSIGRLQMSQSFSLRLATKHQDRRQKGQRGGKNNARNMTN